MAKCYVIAIGGTGARVLTSLYHLCGSGAIERSDFEIKLLCVDSDESNGNIEKLKEISNAYNALNNELNIFPVINTTAGNGGFWSPQMINNQSMADAIQKNDFSEQAKSLLDLLYTDGEQNHPLPRGYYGHTVIGSYFMHKAIVDADDNFTPAWSNYFNGIDTSRDKVFIIGSLYGGTGASGIPTISRIIKNKYPDASIGAMLVMPYFEIDAAGEAEMYDGIGKIDSKLFIPKIRSALSFYRDQKFDKIFETMYFVGEKDGLFMTVSNNNGGTEQKNKANHIETLAAAVILDFMKNEGENGAKPEYSVRLYDEDMSDALKLNNIVPGRDMYDRIVRFFAFCSLHIRYLCPAAANLSQGDDVAEGWTKYYKPELRHAELFLTYAKHFMEWIYEISVNTKPTGEYASIYSQNKNTAGESIAEWVHADDMGSDRAYMNLYYPAPLQCDRKKKNPFSKVFIHSYNYRQLDCLESAALSARLKPASLIIAELAEMPPENEGSAPEMVKLYKTVYDNCMIV